MYKNKFGELLKKYAEESGIESGSELARMAGLSPATVTRIYTGKQKATPETLEALAPHVGKTYEHLMHQAGYLYHNPISQNNITYVCEDPGTKPVDHTSIPHRRGFFAPPLYILCPRSSKVILSLFVVIIFN